MSDISLYKICLRRVYALVKAGTWNSCSINPFLNFPSGIIDDLMKSTPDIPKTSEVLLLLTSGSLTRLHLTPFGLQGEGDAYLNTFEPPEERDLFLNAIQTNCFRSLHVLHWHSKDYKNNYLMETLIRSCPKLEEFHSSKFVNFEVFLNCEELKILIFYASPFLCDFIPDPVNLSVLASLRNLQVFFTANMGKSLTAKVLNHCPHLISLGHNDSLSGLVKAHANLNRNCDPDCAEISNRFQLKKCVWGEQTHNLNLEKVDIVLYKSKFPERVRIAVSLCPLVEDLIIYVYHKDALECLKNLKQLIRLKITFQECDDDYMANFLALLKVIGPNLKCLSVDASHHFPVDMICECCPQLESLEIARFATVSNSGEPHLNVNLKNLRIMKMDENALVFLISSCKNLVELFLCDALCLDDNVLSRILILNPLAELKICDIAESSLTEKGFRMLLQTAVSLQRVSFFPFNPGRASMFEKLITELNLTNVIYGDIFDVPYSELGFFPPFF